MLTRRKWEKSLEAPGMRTVSCSKCLNGSKEPETDVVLAGQQVVTTCRLAERTQNKR